jgi:hypothetical protein
MTQAPNPTLAGAERGRRPRAVREIPGGVYFVDKDTAEVTQKAAYLRPTSERITTVCFDYAEQMCEARGDKRRASLSRWAGFFEMHFALIEPPHEGVALKAMFDPPPCDDKGRLNIQAVHDSALADLAAGQLQIIAAELNILRATQTPDHLSHAQWEAIVSEGKTQSLGMLHSRHGSSALIAVLHGFAGALWPGFEPGSNGDSTR